MFCQNDQKLMIIFWDPFQLKNYQDKKDVDVVNILFALYFYLYYEILDSNQVSIQSKLTAQNTISSITINFSNIN